MKSFGAYQLGDPAGKGRGREADAGSEDRSVCDGGDALAVKRNDGSQAAKQDLALPAGRGAAGLRAAGIERAEASAEDFRGDAGAGESGFVDHQQRKSGAH